jgi:hypothetical protein
VISGNLIRGGDTLDRAQGLRLDGGVDQHPQGIVSMNCKPHDSSRLLFFAVRNWFRYRKSR